MNTFRNASWPGEATKLRFAPMTRRSTSLDGIEALDRLAPDIEIDPVYHADALAALSSEFPGLRMPRKFIVTIAAALISSAASAAPLSEQDKALVGVVAGSAGVIAKCSPEYKAGESYYSTSAKMGDKIGADTEHILLAVAAAVLAVLGKDYDRKDIVPEVTRLTIEIFKKVENESSQNKAKFCKRWGDKFVDMHILKRK